MSTGASKEAFDALKQMHDTAKARLKRILELEVAVEATPANAPLTDVVKGYGLDAG